MELMFAAMFAKALGSGVDETVTVECPVNRQIYDPSKPIEKHLCIILRGAKGTGACVTTNNNHCWWLLSPFFFRQRMLWFALVSSATSVLGFSSKSRHL